jgi:flagellar M-ring protein FliF
MSEVLQTSETTEKGALNGLRLMAGRLVQTWRQQTGGHQRRLALMGALVLVCLGALCWWAMQPTWKVLYSGLPSEDARQIAAMLTAAGLKYDVSADGTILRVPSEMLDKARLATAAKASGKGGRLGFELFDKPNWAGSDFDEKVNYQRALEGELEHTIDTLADVQSSRVHLVLPHDALFQEQQRDAKASVVLRLKSNHLNDSEADSIRSLVASAVDDLQPDHVVLVDADGHSSLGGKTGADATAVYEQTLADHILQTLEPVAGEGNVRATVAVDYDSSATEETEEKYDPSATVNLSMQRSEEISGAQTPASGVPGTASNAPNQKPPLFPSKQGGLESSKEESGTYAASKKTSHRVQGPGRLRRITAAVLVNDRTLTTSAKKTSVQQPWTPDEMKEMVLLAQAAVGYDATRGDQVVVQNLRFEAPIASSSNPLQRLLQGAPMLETVLRYGTILAITAAFFFLVWRPLVAGQGKNSGVPPDGPPPPGLPFDSLESGGAHAVQGSQVLFQQVIDHIHRDPAQSARILQTWMKAE